MQWEFTISYKSKSLLLKAEMVYESTQLQRIKVYGSKSFIMLQNNYPLLKQNNKASSPVKWQMIEGSLKDARLLTHIIFYLEGFIKEAGKE